ncbi:hypothetical protein BC826DRAFT_971313 [Russula brevipes]|nr:hypothetical protein BC826DRAFT_971313 [Russula brevipes]
MFADDRLGRYPDMMIFGRKLGSGSKAVTTGTSRDSRSKRHALVNTGPLLCDFIAQWSLFRTGATMWHSSKSRASEIETRPVVSYLYLYINYNVRADLVGTNLRPRWPFLLTKGWYFLLRFLGWGFKMWSKFGAMAAALKRVQDRRLNTLICRGRKWDASSSDVKSSQPCCAWDRVVSEGKDLASTGLGQGRGVLVADDAVTPSQISEPIITVDRPTQ